MSLLALLTARGIITPTPEPEPETPPVDPATLTTLRHVTNNAGWWRGSTVTGDTGRWHLTRHEARMPATDLRYQQGVHGWAGADNGITGRAGFVIRGRVHWLTWDGAEQVTIPRLQVKLSDPLEGVVIAEGETIYSVWEGAPGSVIPSGHHTMDYTLAANGAGPFPGVTPTASKQLSGAPTAILGMTAPDNRPRSVALIGDSFLEQGGWGRHALEASKLAWTDVSQWAEGTPSGLPGVRFPQVDPFPFDVVVTAYGGNNSSYDLETQHATHIQHWSSLRATGADVAAMTLHPYSYSTDGFKTVENQTVREGHRGETRVLRNEWLRDGAPLVDGVAAETGTTDPSAVRAKEPGHPLTLGIFEQSAPLETEINSGIWRVEGGAWTADGAHLTVHGAKQLQPHFEAWVAENLAGRI